MNSSLVDSVTPGAGLDPAPASNVAPATTMTTKTTMTSCTCLHRKRTLDTLRQRLARRLKRARRHRHDVIDSTATDDVTDDLDTSTGEPTAVYSTQTVILRAFDAVSDNID